MIKTFVYGTPHGFDFYEKDAVYTEYFKGFYISSRKGRRLMVNRRDNGETTYNYLRYELREVEIRPNSFFGMTIVLDDGQYCPNFNKILEWFDYIFEKLLNEKNIFKRNVDGEIQYAINKFDDSVSEVEWIKSNLPKIFSQAAGTNILQYDNTFVSGKTGQIPGLNDEQTDNYYLSIFRKNYWITLSPEFPKQDEIMPPSKEYGIIGGSIELSYPDLKNQLDDFNKRLVPIATGVNQGSLDELTKMYDNAKQSYDSLSQYSTFIKGTEEAGVFENLFYDYESLVNSISAFLSKKEDNDTSCTSLIPEEANTQYCYNCKQHKDVSHFQSSSSMKCIECESAEQAVNRNTKIQCRKCGKLKIAEEFNKSSNICRSCQEQEQSQTKTCKRCGEVKPLNAFPLNSDICQECTDRVNWGKFFRKSIIPFFRVFAVLAVFSIIGGIIYGIINKEKKGEGSNSAEIAANSDSVSIDVLNDFLTQEQFENAYKYIANKKDKNNYFSHIAAAIDVWIWEIIDNSNSSDSIALKNELELKIRPLSQIKDLGIDDKYISTLHDGAKDYTRLQTILTKVRISENEYNEGCQILKRIGSKLPSNWGEALSTKWEASLASSIVDKQDNEESIPPGPITFTYTKVDGTIETLTDITTAIGKEAKPGTKVTVSYPNGKIFFENRKSPTLGEKTITLDSDPSRRMTYKFRCDKIVITITINPNKPKYH